MTTKQINDTYREEIVLSHPELLEVYQESNTPLASWVRRNRALIDSSLDRIPEAHRERRSLRSGRVRGWNEDLEPGFWNAAFYVLQVLRSREGRP